MTDRPEARASPARRLPAGLRIAAAVVGGLLLSLAGLLLAAWLALALRLLPDIERFRPQVQAQATRLLGTPVEIGHLAMTSSGWAPTFELRRVVVRDAAGRAALELPLVVATVSPRSLLGLQPRLEMLRVDGPTLEVRRDAAGRLTVAGFDLGGPASGGSSAAADWVFTQYAVEVRGGAVRWVDEQRAAPPLALTDTDIELHNGLRSHDLRIDATPPVAWGDRFTITGRFTQPLLAARSDWRRWSGTLELALPRADVADLHTRVDLPFELDSGAGSLAASITVRDGQARAAALDLKLQAVRLRLARELQPLALTELSGHLDVRQDAAATTLAARQLGFVTADGARWPAADLRLLWRQAAGAPPAGGEFSAQRLDLAVLAQLATRMPLGASLRRLLAELAPQGEMTGLTANWDGALDAPLHYQVKAAVAGLSLRAQPAADGQGLGRPGLAQAQFAFTASEHGGLAQLGMAGGQIELPGLWQAPQLPLGNLDAQLSWRIDAAPPGAAPAARPLSVQLRVKNLANADLAGDFQLDWHTGTGVARARGGRFPGVLDLSGRLTRAEAAQVARYLPLGLSEAARSYVSGAAFKGPIAAVAFRVRGDLWDFPFGRAGDAKGGGPGEFHVQAHLADVECFCVPRHGAAGAGDWPAFTHLAGDLVFDRRAMEIRNAQAEVRGLRLAGVNGRIPDLAERPRLSIDGRIQGPLAAMLRYVDDTPVRAWTGGALALADASGAAQLQLALEIPLRDAAQSTVKGSLVLDGNDLQLRADLPPLTAAQARIDFTEQGWSMQGAHARLLGGMASIDGGGSADGGLHIAAQGSVSVDGLRRAPGLGTLSRLANSLDGQARYWVAVGLVQGQPEIDLVSDLVGLASALPAPLHKSAETALPLHVRGVIAPESLVPGQTLRDTLRVDLGSQVQAQFVRQLQGRSMRVVRGVIGVGPPGTAAAALPVSGVAASLRLETLDAEAWQRAVASWAAPAGERAASAPPAAVGASPKDSDYLPSAVRLQAQRLLAGRLVATQVVADARRDGPGWHVDLGADTLALGGRPLGRLEMQATRGASAAAGPDPWQLTRLLVTAPGARLEGHGTWTAGAAAASAGRSALDFTLALDDSGVFLDRIGLPNSIKAGKGSLTGQLSWPGSLWEPSLATLGGQMKLALAAGQFLKAEPGAARLLSVLSLQSLARRLTLDFRDLFDAGFAFDDLTGDFRIAQGVATSNDLRMRGAQAAVLMEGSADLVHQTQELHVVVVPEVNAGTASLAYAVINPALGLGTFLAQYFLRQPLMRAATREFRVSGPWDDPKVEALDRPAAAAASAPGPVH